MIGDDVVKLHALARHVESKPLYMWADVPNGVKYIPIFRDICASEIEVEYPQWLDSNVHQRKWSSILPGKESEVWEECVRGRIKEHRDGVVIKTRLHECTVKQDPDATGITSEGNPFSFGE